jgi:hypothetical protein
MEMDKTHMNTHGCRDLERAIAPNGKTAKGSHPINLGVRVGLSSVIRFVSLKDISKRTCSALI